MALLIAVKCDVYNASSCGNMGLTQRVKHPRNRRMRMTTEAAPAVVRLSKKQIEAMIDGQARRRLGMSGEEFRRRLQANRLPRHSVAVRDIAMLVKLAGEDNAQKRRSALR